MTTVPKEQALELALLYAKVVEHRLVLAASERNYKLAFIDVCVAYGLNPEEWTIHVNDDDATLVRLVHASHLSNDHPLAIAYAAKKQQEEAQQEEAQQETDVPPLGDFDQDHPEGDADLGDDDEELPDTENE